MTHIDRARLARELHDGIAQDLVGVGYCLDLLLAKSANTPEMRAELRALRFTITELVDKVRHEIFSLRQESTGDLAHQIQEIAHSTLDGIDITFRGTQGQLEVDEVQEYELRRATEEILRNIRKHAKAKTVLITLCQERGQFEVTIKDDGIGGATYTDSRFGMQGIRDRVHSLNGEIDVDSNASGTRVTLKIPIASNA